MKTLVLAGVLLLVPIWSLAQGFGEPLENAAIAAPMMASEMQTPTVRLGEPVSIAWDYTAADLTNGNVSRFEVRVDSGAQVNTAVVIPSPTGTYQYQIPNSLLPIGLRTVSVRACNPTACGPSASSPVEITPMLPVIPGNPRIVPGATPVTVDQAVEMAQSYSFLFQLRRLNDSEIWMLSSRYGYPLTKGHVLQFMDEQAAGLGQ